MLRLWGTVERWLVSLCGLAGLLLAVYQMGTRYLHPAWFVDWAEETVVYLVIWSIWLASSGLVAENRHVRADLVIRLLPGRVQFALEIVNTLVGLGFCGLVFYGFDIRFESSKRLNVQLLGFPLRTNIFALGAQTVQFVLNLVKPLTGGLFGIVGHDVVSGVVEVG